MRGEPKPGNFLPRAFRCVEEEPRPVRTSKDRRRGWKAPNEHGTPQRAANVRNHIPGPMVINGRAPRGVKAMGKKGGLLEER